MIIGAIKHMEIAMQILWYEVYLIYQVNYFVMEMPRALFSFNDIEWADYLIYAVFPERSILLSPPHINCPKKEM